MPSESLEESVIRAEFDALQPSELWGSERIKWRLHAEGVLPAWVADMDYPVASPIKRALHALVTRSDLGYHRVPLSPRLRAALVDRMQARFGWPVEARRIVPLVNVVQGLDATVLLHSQPGEGVIVQTPVYPPFLAAVEKSGRRLVENTLQPGSTRYEIDFDRLSADIDPATRVFLFCNPHNPTGRVFERAELERLAEIAIAHDLIVVSDEIHADLVYPGHTHIPLASLGPEIAERTVTLTSATKAFNLAGLPCAFAIFGGDRAQKPFRELPPHLLGHCGILDDAATFTAWTEGQPWQDAVLGYLRENRDATLDFLAGALPGVRVLPPEATYLAWLDCRALGLDNPKRFFLEHARVALSAGSDYGTSGAGFVRLNFATSASILREILERMASAVNEKADIG